LLLLLWLLEPLLLVVVVVVVVVLLLLLLLVMLVGPRTSRGKSGRAQPPSALWCWCCCCRQRRLLDLGCRSRHPVVPWEQMQDEAPPRKGGLLRALRCHRPRPLPAAQTQPSTRGGPAVGGPAAAPDTSGTSTRRRASLLLLLLLVKP